MLQVWTVVDVANHLAAVLAAVQEFLPPKMGGEDPIFRRARDKKLHNGGAVSFELCAVGSAQKAPLPLPTCTTTRRVMLQGGSGSNSNGRARFLNCDSGSTQEFAAAAAPGGKNESC